MTSKRARWASMLAVLVCLCLLTLLVASCGNPQTTTEDTDKSWDFERFDSDIQVHDDGSFTVRETQVINFRGSFSFITRDLSSQLARDFTEGRTYGKVRIRDIEVYNLDGTPYDPSLWEINSYQGGKTVRIEFQARDEQRGWIISYRMKGAIIYAEDYDRLYWNAVSYYREVPIASSRVTVSLPPGTDMSEVEYTDYFSPYPDGSIRSGRSGDTIWWEVENIWPYQDLTIDVSVPKGVIDIPFPYRTSTLWLTLGIALAVLLGTLAVMLALWWARGRDAYGGPIKQVSYEPPRELRPAVMGMLVYQQPRVDDISATVVDLAVRGKLRIIEEPDEDLPGETQFSFERKDASTADLLPYESKLMGALFGRKGTRVTQKDAKIGDRLYPLMNSVRKEVGKRRLFLGDPEKTKSRYFRWGVALVLLPPIIMFILQFFLDLGYFWILLAGLIPAGVITAVISYAMPRRTPEGARLFWQAMGFKEFLKTAEAGEAASMTPQTFQDNLPYAMVLGLDDKWASLFAGIYTTAPDWYEGSGAGFSTTSLTSGLRDMGSGLIMSGRTSSGSGGGFHSSGGGGFGGGSSGGGFGGGGSSAG